MAAVVNAVRETGDDGLSRTAYSKIFKGNFAAKDLDAFKDGLIKAELVAEVWAEGNRKAGLVAIKNDELDELDGQAPDSSSSSNSLIGTSDKQAEAEAVRDLYYQSE